MTIVYWVIWIAAFGGVVYIGYRRGKALKAKKNQR